EPQWCRHVGAAFGRQHPRQRRAARTRNAGLALRLPDRQVELDAVSRVARSDFAALYTIYRRDAQAIGGPGRAGGREWRPAGLVEVDVRGDAGLGGELHPRTGGMGLAVERP